MLHGLATTRTDAGLLALNAGVDLDMVSGIYLQQLPDMVRKGKVKEDVVNEAARRVLRAKFTLGLFKNPVRGTSTRREKMSMLTSENLTTALEAARKSIVLLKNENALLPLSKQIKTIAVIGPLADNKHEPLGPWHAGGRPENVVTVLEGIKSHVLTGTSVLHSKGCEIDGDSLNYFDEAKRIAQQADVSILVLGESERMSGEAASRSILNLPGKQEELLMSIHKSGKPIVLVLMNGRPLTIPWAADHVPAILESWFLGVQTGNAIADVLFGDVNPSGKLPVSFPRSIGQIPIYYNHKNTGRPFSEMNRYTSKYLDVDNTPLYPFGFGLSYTTFLYSNLRVSALKVKENQSLKVTVDVSNSGTRRGDEIVQLYIQDEVASVTRPVKELKGFQRLTLEPGEKKSVEFAVEPIAFYNQQMKLVVEPGMFKVFVGRNSMDCLEAEFELLDH